MQLRLDFATAERPCEKRGPENERTPGQPEAKSQKGPKATFKWSTAGPARMEQVVVRLEQAFANIAANKGAPGPDRQSIEEVRKRLPEILAVIRPALLNGTYQPGSIRRVWIPKGKGKGQRGLGIPNVVDRMVQEAVRLVLEPLCEPTFHPSSHGFRPNRGCHTAIAEAKGYVEQGNHWVVDIDLEKFFDRVHHQRLMSKLAQRVDDKRLLVLISRMLKAEVIMPDGVRVATEEGLPQGGPLSPLLSNIVLDELDQELDRRGHRFVRYADDCNIYVGSERAGQRVMASLTRFLDKRLRLKVNASKSAVARPQTRHFLGFRLVPDDQGEVGVLLSDRSVKRFAQRIREITRRSRGRSLQATIREVNAFLVGWLSHFRICTRGVWRIVKINDGHLRRRLRAIVLKHWKRKRTIARRLISRGVSPRSAWKRVYEGLKSFWALSKEAVVHRALPNAYFADLGLISIEGRFKDIWKNTPALKRQPAGDGVNNSSSRRAVCDQHKYGSVGAGAGNRPGYPTTMSSSAGDGSLGREARPSFFLSFFLKSPPSPPDS